MFSKVDKKELAIFSKHLSVMLKSGVNVVDALETLQNQTKSKSFKDVIAKCAIDLKGGVNLAAAFAKYPKVFDQFYLSIIAIGEESGTLSESLTYLEKKLENEVLLKKKVDEALFYPKLVLSLAFVVGFAISIFVLPQLGKMFQSFDVQLPLITRLLLGFADFMKVHGVLLFSVILGVVVLVSILIRWKPIRAIWTRLLLGLPIIGPFLIQKEVSSFCRNLGIMLTSGVSISRALTICSDTTENALFADYIRRLKRGLDEGKTLGATLQNGKFRKMPEMVTKMITVGEKSGSLSEMLLYLADNYEASTDDQAKNLSAMIEPVMLTMIAGVVLIVALAIILPIYQLSDVLK